MSADTIDALIAMSERINDLIAIENEKLEKLAADKAALEARQVMADALALIRKGKFHSDDAQQVAAVKTRLVKGMR